MQLNFPEADLCFDTDIDARYYTTVSAPLLPMAFLKSSTKILSFPGRLPTYQIGYKYMDIYQPHGSPPEAKSSCAFWGAWKDQTTTWRSVASFSSRQMAELYRDCLTRGNKRPPDSRSLLSSHWVNLLRVLYIIGVNDGRLILRNAADDIEQIVSIHPILK